MKNDSKKPNVVIAGEDVHAGIEEDETSKIPYAMVIEFQSEEQFIEAMEARKVDFDWFSRK